VALQSVRRSIALDSTSPVAWHFLARFLAETGDLGQAIDAWRRSVSAGPRYTQGLAFLGLAHLWRRTYDSAARWADSTLAIDPTYLLGLSTVGQVAVEQGNYTRAIAVSQAAQRLTTAIEYVNSLAAEGLARGRTGDRQASQAILRRADSLARRYEPTPLHTAVYLAHAYTGLNLPGPAIGWLYRYSTPGDLHFQLHLRCDPPLDPLHENPRFRALLLLPVTPAGKGC
jgi:tetratricopeptide (TPR) repeat protein